MWQTWKSYTGVDISFQKDSCLKIIITNPSINCEVKKNKLEEDQQKEPQYSIQLMLSWCSQQDSMHITCTGELFYVFQHYAYQKGFLSYLGKSL